MTNLPNRVGPSTTNYSVQELRYNLLQSCSWLNNEVRRLLSPYEITPKQYSILRNLAATSPRSASIQEVRNGLADQMSDASRLIDRLVKKGYLEKFPSDLDRRSNRVRISNAGLDIIKQINARRDDFERLVSDRLTMKQIAELNRLLALLK